MMPRRLTMPARPDAAPRLHRGGRESSFGCVPDAQALDHRQAKHSSSHCFGRISVPAVCSTASRQTEREYKLPWHTAGTKILQIHSRFPHTPLWPLFNQTQKGRREERNYAPGRGVGKITQLPLLMVVQDWLSLLHQKTICMLKLLPVLWV